MRIGYRHTDRLISYPHAHNLSVSQLPIRVGGRFRRPGGQARMERPGHSADGGLRNLMKVPESAKVRPIDTPPTHTRDRTRPARYKTSILCHLACAGRTMSRPCCLPRHEMSPSAPMREPEDACMKPTTSLLDEIAAKTGVSGLQWCRRFHRRQSTRQRRR